MSQISKNDKFFVRTQKVDLSVTQGMIKRWNRIAGMAPVCG